MSRLLRKTPSDLPGTQADMDACVTCREPLLVTIESDEEDGADQVDAEPSQGQGTTVPDSVELSCGCKFHWSVFWRLSTKSGADRQF